MKRNWVSLIAVVMVTGIGVIWGLQAKRVLTNSVVACTDEAKICPDGSAVGRTGPNCAFASCPSVDEPAGTTLSNSTIGLSFTLPADWYVMGNNGVKVDPKNYLASTNLVIGNGAWGTNGSSISIQARKTSSLDSYPQTVAQWRAQTEIYAQTYTSSSVKVGNATATKMNAVDKQIQDIFLISRGEWFYEILAANDKVDTKAVLASMKFSAPEAVSPPTNPILSLKNLDYGRKFSGYDITAISRISDQVLIGGSKSFLQMYNRTTKKFTDLSGKLNFEDPQFRTVTAIENNGSYWLAVLSGRSENKIVKISGTTVTEITSFAEVNPNHPARMDTVAYQNGKWLFGSYGGGLYAFDGTNWDDLSPVTKDRVPPIEAITDIEPDNGSWRIAAENKVYTLSGITLTEIEIEKLNNIEELATNGTEWLGVSSSGVISIQKKSGGIFETLGAATPTSNQPVWLGSVWLVSDTFVQGKTISNPVLSNFYGGFSTPLIAEGGVGYVGHRDGYIYEFTYQLPK